MKKHLKILTLIFSILLLSILIYERYFLTKRYSFEIENIKIKVISDECETCWLDWPINHTIWIKSDDAVKKFEVYTEGPRLEFGLNSNNSKLLINCPGFSSMFINLDKMSEIVQKKPGHNNFQIQWIVNKNKELIKLDTTRLPDNNWNEE